MDGISDPYIVQQSLKAALQLGRFHGQGSVSFLTRDRAAVSLRRLFGPRNREHFHPLVRRLSNHLYGIKGDEALLGKLAELKDDPEIINFIYSPITPQSAEEIEFDRLLKAEVEEIPDEKFDELVPKPVENEATEGVESKDSSGPSSDSGIRQAEDRGWAESSATDSTSSSTASHDRTRFPSRGSLTINRPAAPVDLTSTVSTGLISSSASNIAGPTTLTNAPTNQTGSSSLNTDNSLNFPTDALSRGVNTVTQSNIAQNASSQAQIFGRQALTNWIPNVIGTFIPIFKPSGGEAGAEPPWGSPTSTAGYAGEVPKDGVYSEEQIEDTYYYEEEVEPPRQEKKGLPPFLLMLLPVVGFFGLFLFMDLSKSSALLPPYEIPGRPTNPEGDASTNVPGLIISKVGPARVSNNEDITYTINITYSGSASVEVVDQIPVNTQFVSASGNFKKSPETAADTEVRTITWLLKDNPPEMGGKYNFNFVLHPTKEDVSVRNTVRALATETVSASPLPGSSPGVNPSSAPGTPPIASNPGDSEFDSLMRGQGRNVNVLGNETNFVATVMANSGRNFSGKEQNLRIVYQTAVAGNINPLAILVIWGTETGFAINGQEFSCPVGETTSFSAQVGCAVKTYNSWMNAYDRTKRADGTADIDVVKKDPGTGKLVKTGEVCTYNDSFLYATEMYGPDCHYYHNNENFRPNFVKFYRQFSGQ